MILEAKSPLGVLSVIAKDSYKRRYKMRTLGKDGRNIVVSIPRVILEREAEKKGITFEKLIDTHRAVAHYNGFNGIYYTIEEIE